MSTHVHLFIYAIIYFATIWQIYLHQDCFTRIKRSSMQTNEWMFLTAFEVMRPHRPNRASLLHGSLNQSINHCCFLSCWCVWYKTNHKGRLSITRLFSSPTVLLWQSWNTFSLTYSNRRDYVNMYKSLHLLWFAQKNIFLFNFNWFDVFQNGFNWLNLL